MQILDKPASRAQLLEMAMQSFGEMVKAVVDVDLKLMAIDAELHSDLEALLLGNGSSQSSLWGINLYPGLDGEDSVEFDSMINLRPSHGNMSRGVDDDDVRRRIIGVVELWVRS